MRNKGFFWFLTILLTAVCVYQLSFTWVSNSVENKAAKTASLEVATLKEQAMKNGGFATINGAEVDFNTPEGEEIAKAAIINRILKEKAESKVYPVFGSTFSEVKKRSLAFGLDLVGGMSVTMEISIPELVKSYARSERDLKFKKVYEAAKAEYDRQGGDFVDIFVAKHRAINGNEEVVRLFAITDIEGLDAKSTDQDVIDYLKDKVTSSMDGVEEIMNRRINQFGVSQPNIQKDPANNRLYIELPGVQDEVTVAEQLQSTANLQFFETYFPQEIQAQWSQAQYLSTQPEQSIEELEAEEDDTTNVDGADDSKSLEETLTDLKSTKKGLADLLKPAGAVLGFATPANRSEVEAILRRKDIQNVLPEDMKLMWGADIEKYGDKGEQGYYLYAIRVPASGKARVGGKDIESASTGLNQEGKITVNLKMTNDGSDKWGLMTSENVDRLVAITMDNVVYSAPNVKGAINQGSTEISGTFTIEEAKDLAGLLNGGALPAPCVIKEQTKVGPTIGAENTRAGLMSFGIALLLVFVYMIFYYGKAGIIADIALFANILFIFGSLASFGAVLTLAGIAGIVLTIGMAVDANVLIFERIREEEAAGKDKKAAIDTGFKKALSSIVDANVTTLLTAIVLKVFGSGPIESFATTLIIGIFTSMFAALVISRLIFNWILSKGKTIEFETKMTKGAFKNFTFDFVGKRKVFYIISSIIVVGGLAAMFGRGFNQSVEFSGGRTFGVKFEKDAGKQLNYLETNLRSVFDADGNKTSLLTKTKGSSYFVEITTNFMLGDESANATVIEKLREGLDKSKANLGSYTIQESRSVSPTISDELKSSSLIAIVLSLIIIFAYILIRFGKWQYSTGAILAMTHDVIAVLAVFALFHGILPFNMEIDQAFVAAILTVIGYSINDTVIVFDRIRENLGMHSNKTQAEEINQSLNSTLSRTINTSMTTFLVLLVIFLFGGVAIKSFVFALMIGVLVGTYSSLCIATPLLIDLSKKIKA